MSRRWDDATLERALRDAAGPLAPMSDERATGLVEGVLAGLATEPAPVPSPAARLRARLADAFRWLRARAGRLLAALVVLVFGVAVSPVGAQVAEWFDFHGVLVGPEEDEPEGEPTIPPAPGELTVGQAAELVAFRPVVPRILGEPDAVSVSEDGRLLSMSWGSGRETVRLDQFEGSIQPAFYKASSDVRRVDVDGRDGLWFPTPHAVDVLTLAGEPATLEPRLAAPTLVWETDGVTYRLESRFTEGESVVVAESAE